MIYGWCHPSLVQLFKDLSQFCILTLFVESHLQTLVTIPIIYLHFYFIKFLIHLTTLFFAIASTIPQLTCMHAHKKVGKNLVHVHIESDKMAD